MTAGLLFLVEALALPLAVAAATGCTVGAASCSADPMKAGGRMLVALAGVILVIGAAAALTAWLPGRPGLWLDTALLLAAAYIGGCALGCLARRIGSRPKPRAETQTATPGSI